MTFTYSIMSFYFFYSFLVCLEANFQRKKHTTSQKDPKPTPYTSWNFKEFNILAVLISFQRDFLSFL